MNNTPAWVESSPWFDPNRSNLFRYELQLARENDSHSRVKPHPLFTWIQSYDGEQLLFNGLARFAPMFPTIAYHGQVAVWTSPPPSGSGNAVFIVMGHDGTGEIRLVGGNYFTEPVREADLASTSVEFFNNFDRATTDQRQELIRKTVMRSMAPEDMNLVHGISRQCDLFHTMGVYIVALTPQGGLFAATPAVIEGCNPANFSFEFLGEVK